MIQTEGTCEEVFGSNDIVLTDYNAENDVEGMGSTCEPANGEMQSSVELGGITTMHHNIYSNETTSANPERDEYTKNETWGDENDILTKNLANIIYNEAKNDALFRIENGPLYHSDNETR